VSGELPEIQGNQEDVDNSFNMNELASIVGGAWDSHISTSQAGKEHASCHECRPPALREALRAADYSAARILGFDPLEMRLHRLGELTFLAVPVMSNGRS
jgi:hypothetical protein